MRLLLCLTAILLLCGAKQPTDLAFGEYHPHTRWIDWETHTIVVDAFSHRLVISKPGEPVAAAIPGCWQGRAFLAGCKSDFFAVAHEGTDAAFLDSPLKKLHFRRVRPDPT